jgi:hypothetical protein
MVDNTPILGIAIFRPDVIITVYLDASISRVKHLHACEYGRIRRICGEHPALDWFENATFLPIIPSRDLGGWRGTLDFSERTARVLMKLGYEDALRALRQASSS